MKQSKTFRMVIYAILGSMATALMFFSFPLPMFLPFLSIDFSEIPVLLAAILFSPVAGIIVAGIKIFLYFLFMGAGDPIGLAANFIASLLFVLPVAYVYHRFRSVKGLMLGLGIGTVVMAVTMSILNYLIILPAYTWLIGMEAMSSQVLFTTAIAGILPFNLIKGGLVTLLFVPFFVKLLPWLQQQSHAMTMPQRATRTTGWNESSH